MYVKRIYSQATCAEKDRQRVIIKPFQGAFEIIKTFDRFNLKWGPTHANTFQGINP